MPKGQMVPSALSLRTVPLLDWQPDCHTNATSHSLLRHDQKGTRQSLASTVSARRIAASSYCHCGRHANVVTPCLFAPCLNLPDFEPAANGGGWRKKGEENLTKDTPPKNGFWTPPSSGTFSTPLGADLWEGDATKHFSVKKRGFQ